MTLAAISIELVLYAARRRQLCVWLARAPGVRRERWALPGVLLTPRTELAEAAVHAAVHAVGTPPAWLEQVGAFSENGRRAGAAALTVGFVGLIPAAHTPAGDTGRDGEWFATGNLPALSVRHRGLIDAAMVTLRLRMDIAPVAFRLLPSQFTLSALQQAYELLLGRRLHKASFRRALNGAHVVKPTGNWFSEGRGRPAQLFTYSPRNRRGNRRSVRF